MDFEIRSIAIAWNVFRRNHMYVMAGGGHAIGQVGGVLVHAEGRREQYVADSHGFRALSDSGRPKGDILYA